MKICSTCKQEKSIKDFWKSKRTKDGLKGYCKDCGKANNHKYVANGYMNQYMGAYYKTHYEARKIKGDRAVAYNKRTGHDKIYNKVKHLKAVGKIISKPCLICKSEKVHAHHKDYSKPLDLTWLCPSHHRAVHKGLLVV